MHLSERVSLHPHVQAEDVPLQTEATRRGSFLHKQPKPRSATKGNSIVVLAEKVNARLFPYVPWTPFY